MGRETDTAAIADFAMSKLPSVKTFRGAGVIRHSVAERVDSSMLLTAEVVAVKENRSARVRHQCQRDEDRL